MVAVSDTSPLCYLILIDEVDLLPKIFGRVVLPEMVRQELLHEDAPKAVRAWAADLPSCVEVDVTPLSHSAPMAKLQAGEQAAILTAEV